ncbi:MAG TPA: sulfatase-like hydrolase/transferase [Blastocatellia bacterium]|nr:sulfatase-like hydrolase/transferase [Blastocatellia bacterium]
MKHVFKNRMLTLAALLKDLITAVSLSNLCFLAGWRSVIYSPDPHGYHLTEHAVWRQSVGLIIDVLILATLFWASYAFVRRLRQERLVTIASWGFLFVTFAALDGVRRQFYGPLHAPAFIAIVGRPIFIGLLAGLAFLIVFTLARHSRRVISVARAIILILSPFALMTFAQTSWSLLKTHPANAEAKNKSAEAADNAEAANNDNTRPVTRVLWVIFDEFDYHAAFAERPTSVELPELDRLRAESVVAENAYSPARWTMKSLPALVTGRLVADARPSNYNELALTFDGASASAPWSAQPNVFSRARAIGAKSALVGWYHPYCRVIGGDLTRCSFTVIANETDRLNQRLSQSMLEHFRTLGRGAPVIRDLLPKSAKVGTRWESDYVESIKRMSQESAAAAADGALSLVMVHFPAPHFPCQYDRRKHDFTIQDFGVKSRCNYFDNLGLVDRTFGDLRRAMELAGWWDNTVVLVSSDHGWRTEIWPKNYSLTEEEQVFKSDTVDYRVPFILKLKGQRESLIYQPSFNTILSQDLLLALLRGRLSTPGAVTAWLDHNRSMEKSPY